MERNKREMHHRVNNEQLKQKISAMEKEQERKLMLHEQ